MKELLNKERRKMFRNKADKIPEVLTKRLNKSIFPVVMKVI